LGAIRSWARTMTTRRSTTTTAPRRTHRRWSWGATSCSRPTPARPATTPPAMA
jgi:hypothetical protein